MANLARYATVPLIVVAIGVGVVAVDPFSVEVGDDGQAAPPLTASARFFDSSTYWYDGVRTTVVATIINSSSEVCLFIDGSAGPCSASVAPESTAIFNVVLGLGNHSLQLLGAVLNVTVVEPAQVGETIIGGIAATISEFDGSSFVGTLDCTGGQWSVETDSGTAWKCDSVIDIEGRHSRPGPLVLRAYRCDGSICSTIAENYAWIKPA